MFSERFPHIATIGTETLDESKGFLHIFFLNYLILYLTDRKKGINEVNGMRFGKPYDWNSEEIRSKIQNLAITSAAGLGSFKVVNENKSEKIEPLVSLSNVINVSLL